MHHHNHNFPRTWRLIMAKLHFDEHARQLVADEIGDCTACWRDIAEGLVTQHTYDMVAAHGWNNTVTYTSHAIAGGLDAAARDRGEL